MYSHAAVGVAFGGGGGRQVWVFGKVGETPADRPARILRAGTAATAG
ncbi:hypothetical protein [Streptomyces lomondensis]|nr:hypothetical protein [Streptomyces lomondensis]MCF0081451.1 hypothetical protein [Streptomyces lomondensis]